jgi:Zn finger protein HypA/HybF involved in hydrogenase expression
MKIVNAKSLESTLTPRNPLFISGDVLVFNCLRCNQKFTLDARVYQTTTYKMAKALGVDYLACPHCHARDEALELDGALYGL